MRRSYLKASVYLLILLLAMALRFHRLAVQSFWNDEGNTARLVERSVALIIEGAAGDVHPPGYYLALHAWRSVAGESEFALRAYSALLGFLTVAVTAATARRVGGWFPSVAAAAWLAIHPLAVYYSQEARMYAQLGLAAALTLWCAAMLVRSSDASRRPNPQFALALALSMALGLYTQYTFVLALVGLNLVFGLGVLLHVVRRGASRSWLPLVLMWGAAHALGAVLFLPWAPVALRATGWRPPDLTTAQAVKDMVGALLVGVTLPGEVPALPVVALGALILLALLGLGMGSGSRRGARSRWASFAVWGALGMALVPPALMALAGIYRPAYLKFLLVAVPPLAIALTYSLSGRAFAALRLRQGRRVLRGMAWVALLLLVPPNVRALDHLYYDPAFTRDDYRGIAAHVAELARPGDAILLNAPNQWEVFTYYYRGATPVYAAPYRPTEREAETWVQTIIAQHAQASHGRLFVLYWGDVESDPQRLIERTLAQRSFKAGDTWYNSVRLAVYGTGEPVNEPDTLTEATFDAGEVGIRLVGYHLPSSTWAPGDVIPLTLFWQAEAPPDARFKVFVHLINSEGALVAQVDAEPQAGFAPTTVWTAGDTIVDRYGVFLPPDLDVGTYRLVVGLYRMSGERLPVEAGGQMTSDGLPLADVVVAPAP